MESKSTGSAVKLMTKRTAEVEVKHKESAENGIYQSSDRNLVDNIIGEDFKTIRLADEKTSRSVQTSGYKSTPILQVSSTDSISNVADQRNRNYRRDSKEIEALGEEEDDGDDEFLALMRKPNTGEAMISSDPIARHIASGLKINYMNMRNGETKALLWECNSFGNVAFTNEMNEYIPKSILSCRVISREINFTSRETMNNFRIEQRVFYRGHCIEEWFFSFGFVIPGSTNSWEQIIEAAPPSAMLSAEELTGNVTIETTFLDNKLILCKNLVRVYYV